MSDSDHEKKLQQAEELLGDSDAELSFAQGLFYGRFIDERFPSYPNLEYDEQVDSLKQQLYDFCIQYIDPVKIDLEANIPTPVIEGLGKLGILGACLPKTTGGLELSQTAYCQLLEVLGGHCGSTALFVNAHHSIGPRSIVLFGTAEQQETWLPKLATGKWLSAFALTEPEAGSDAANVQTTASPSEDGSGYILNGEKRWITNGGIAQVLTVMARTPVSEKQESKISAFIVTPEMSGFEVVEKRMEKCGVRGTTTSRLAFHNMFVPRENLLGKQGNGLKIALTVLDYGRTTFGASCTGAAKYCVRLAAEHANNRIQFQQPLGSFELVKDKLAYMQAGTYAMDACTYQTAALVNSGVGEFMIETAMLKNFSTEVLWRIVNDTFQIFGGKAYFTDEPWERMMRDARINMIGEGANDVLRVFIALVGMRGVGLELQSVAEALFQPFGKIGILSRFAQRRIGLMLSPPNIDVRNPDLETEAIQLGQIIQRFGKNVERLLRIHQTQIVDRQYQLARIADTATELYVSACVLRKLDRQNIASNFRNESAAGLFYLKTARRRMRRNLKLLWDNDDEDRTRLANQLLREDQDLPKNSNA